MAVQFKFFNIPVRQLEEAEEKLNKFLVSTRVVDLERIFVDQGLKSFWTVVVEYHTSNREETNSTAARKAKKDYKNILSQEDFSLFVKLREWRKNMAAEEGTPVYVIFTNEQLAAMSSERPDSLSKLKRIEGVGDGRGEKYGNAVISIIRNVILEKDHGEPVK